MLARSPPRDAKHWSGFFIKVLFVGAVFLFIVGQLAPSGSQFSRVAEWSAERLPTVTFVNRVRRQLLLVLLAANSFWQHNEQVASFLTFPKPSTLLVNEMNITLRYEVRTFWRFLGRLFL